MMINLDRALTFMATHARLIDRRRLDLLLRRGHPEDALAAVAAYRNRDGGYGWGLEPELRSAGSQPAGALHAFEAFAEAAPATSPDTAGLCDWLATATLPDGGLPFALPIPDAAGSAPFWVQADASRSSLHVTCAVVEIAQRVAWHDSAVRDHPWLARATDYCWRQVAELDEVRHALEMKYVLQFLDAVHDVVPGAAGELRRLGRLLPPSGRMHVAGGLEDESIGPLDVAPVPDRPVRGLFAADLVEDELDRLAAGQREDGGWTVDFASYSPAAAYEWRGYQTVHAVAILHTHGRA